MRKRWRVKVACEFQNKITKKKTRIKQNNKQEKGIKQDKLYYSVLNQF
jgi:hypothetical protein